jgi:hypothetical protein
VAVEAVPAAELNGHTIIVDILAYAARIGPVFVFVRQVIHVD